MNKKLAWALSVVFQPLLMPTLMVSILMYLVPEATSTPNSAKQPLVLLVALTTFIVPLISMVGMKWTASIDSLHLQQRQQRVFPFSLVTVFYGMTAGFFYFRLQVDQMISMTLILITFCIFLLTLITTFWKISAHLTAVSGLTALLVVLLIRYESPALFYPLLGSVLLSGAVGSARLALDVHRPSEILGGLILGFGVCFPVFCWLLLG